MSAKTIKTVNLGNKKVELHFKSKLSSLPKNKLTKITAAWSSADGNDSGFLDAKYLVDNEGVISIKTADGEFRYTVNADGNLVPSGGTDLFGGAPSKEAGTKLENAREADDRVRALTKIVTRFCAVEDQKCMFDFFGHLLKELHTWLDGEGHKNEAACLLSFVTKIPFFGAVLFLQFVSPMRKQGKSNYLSTKLLKEWISSPSGDRVFGYSVPEKSYASSSTELFKTATAFFGDVKREGKPLASSLTSFHRSIGSKAESEAEFHFENLLTVYMESLRGCAGNRVAVCEENHLLPLHDALCLYELKNIHSQAAEMSPEDVVCLVMRTGIRNALDAQLFNVSRTNDASHQSDIIEKIIKTNLIFPCQAIVQKTDIDFLK